MNKRHFFLLVSASALTCLAAIALAPLLGPTRVDVWNAFRLPGSFDAEILWRARMPRTLFAALVGGCLASAGVVFQAILRNPLASPFTLGVSGGGSLGAVLAIVTGWQLSFFGISLLPLASMAGSMLVVSVVYLLSTSRRTVSPLTLLLSGVVLNYICAALILLIHYFSNFTQSFLMLRWMMGGLDVYDYSILLSLLPFLIVGLFVLFYFSRYLNVLSAGEDWATSRGINVRRTLTFEYFGASVITGAVVAFSGPIGFVGLIVPHLLRLLVGADHRLLLPVSFFAGGSFLIFCDAIARTILAPTEIPVGILTSMLGGPFFLWLLLSRKGHQFGF